ncbi:MAG: hypothetical protein GY791_05820 [Alphaproteobacteria bacterium]|nr:hypothetical protein [Alphaproteobacteria bacterium]
MTKMEASELFAAASLYDPTVKASQRQISDLLCRRVVPTKYSRHKLFTSMARAQPIICRGYPCPMRKNRIAAPQVDRIEELKAALISVSTRAKYRVFTGRTGRAHRATLANIIERWDRGRSIFGVTDLHIRDSKMETVIDPDILSYFNLLRLSTVEAYEQEMFSFVISTRGHVTDSHSDDPDSSNYCFTGRKLWLMWDTFEGLDAGLEDVERCPVYGTAKFDMRSFVALESSRWGVVESGQTLFLPGHYTHKVITLEKYLGVGGFYVSLPNCLRSLARWHIHSPLWLSPATRHRNRNVLADISTTACDRVRRLRRSSDRARENWGVEYLPISDNSFRREYGKDQIEKLFQIESFRKFANTLET